MLELEELARAVRRLAERHDARVADHSLERLHVSEAVASLRGRQANRVAAHPVNGRLVLLSEQRRDRKADQGTNEEEPTRIHLPTPISHRLGPGHADVRPLTAESVARLWGKVNSRGFARVSIGTT